MHDDDNMPKQNRLGLDGDHQKQCDNCRYFCPTGDSGEGDCRRHAPQPAILRDRGHRDDDHARFMSWWPTVNDDDWCGDFESIDGKDW